MASPKEFDALKKIVAEIDTGMEQYASQEKAAKELLAIQEKAEIAIAKKHGLSGPNDNAFSQYDAEVQKDPNFKRAAQETTTIMAEKKKTVEKVKGLKAKAKTAKAALDKVLPKADKKTQDEVKKFYADNKTALS